MSERGQWTAEELLPRVRGCADEALTEHARWMRLELGFKRRLQNAQGFVCEVLSRCFYHTLASNNASLPTAYLPLLRFNASFFELSNEIAPIDDALIVEMHALEQCGGHDMMNNPYSLLQAVRKCVHVRAGISSQFVYRSLYAPQLLACFEHIPRDRVLTLPAELLQANPDVALTRVLHFLGLPPLIDDIPLDMGIAVAQAFPLFEQLTSWRLKGEYPPISTEVSDVMQPFFAAHNALLEIVVQTTEFSDLWRG